LHKINCSTSTISRFPHHAKCVNITINIVNNFHLLYRKIQSQNIEPCLSDGTPHTVLSLPNGK